MKPETRDIAGRIIGATFFSAFAGQRIFFYLRDPGDELVDHLFFVVVTTTFLVMASSYILRARAKSAAKGFMETIFPFIPAVLPLAVANSWWLVYTPWEPYRIHFPRAETWNEFWGPNPSDVDTALALTIVGIAANALVVWGLISLRRAFSIMTEARLVVRSGPYRFVRHPVYLGEILATAAILGIWFSWGAALFFVAFVITQTWRAFNEQRKLTQAFPEYQEYRETTGMFVPKLSSRRRVK